MFPLIKQSMMEEEDFNHARKTYNQRSCILGCGLTWPEGTSMNIGVEAEEMAHMIIKFII